MRLRNVRTVGAMGRGFYGANGVNATIRIEDGVNMQSASTPYNFDSSCNVNRGTVTANGTSAVPVAFRDMTAEETVTLTSTGATPTAYVYSQTAGTGFSIKATAGDTNVYNYMIH